jgi:hypothetical protein
MCALMDREPYLQDTQGKVVKSLGVSGMSTEYTLRFLIRITLVASSCTM